MRFLDDPLQRFEHRRMQIVVQVGDARVVAIDRQQVLGQVVRAHRDEVHLAGQFAGQIDRCRHFDHDADRRHLDVHAFVAYLAPGTVNQVQRLFQLADTRDHRQQDAQVVQPDAGLEHGAGLQQKDFRVIERHPDAAPAEEGIFFLDGEIRQALVAADIQGSHGHRQRMEGFELFAIDRHLLLLAGEAFLDHEGHFGAIQPNAFGASLLGAHHIGEQPGIDPQRNTVAIGGHAGQLAQHVEPRRELTLLLGQLQVLFAQHLGRVGDDLAAGTVDDQLDAIDLRIRQIHRAHYRGNTHGTSKDGDVGVARTQHRDHPRQPAFRHLAEHRRGQLFADQNGFFGVGQGLLARFLQIAEQAPTDVLDVGGALAEVGIVHHLEAHDMVADHLAQRALRPLAGANEPGDLTAQRGILEHHQVDVEQCPLFLAHLAGKPLGQGAHVGAHCLQRRLEERQLGLDLGLFDRFVGHHVQIRWRQHHHRRADGRAGRTGDADEAGFLDALALAAEAADRAGRLGMGDDPGQLRAHGDQEGFLALVELAALLLLDDQHAHHPPVVDDRRTEEGGIAFFARLGEVAVARVFGGMFKVERLLARAHQADQALVGGHADLADGLLVQAFGGHQDEAIRFRIEQVDRADLAGHGLPNPQHNDAQRRLEVLGGVHFLDNLAQRAEHAQRLSPVSPAPSGAGRVLLRRDGKPRA